VVLPSFYAFYLSWLGQLVSPRAAPAALLFVGADIATIGATIGRRHETSTFDAAFAANRHDRELGHDSSGFKAARAARACAVYSQNDAETGAERTAF
jgi:hypothetical protein